MEIVSLMITWEVCNIKIKFLINVSPLNNNYFHRDYRTCHNLILYSRTKYMMYINNSANHPKLTPGSDIIIGPWNLKKLRQTNHSSDWTSRHLSGVQLKSQRTPPPLFHVHSHIIQQPPACVVINEWIWRLEDKHNTTTREQGYFVPRVL